MQIEEKYLKGEGNICNEKEPATKKREPFALSCRESEPFAGRGGRGNHLQKEGARQCAL